MSSYFLYILNVGVLARHRVRAVKEIDSKSIVVILAGSSPVGVEFLFCPSNTTLGLLLATGYLLVYQGGQSDPYSPRYGWSTERDLQLLLFDRFDPPPPAGFNPHLRAIPTSGRLLFFFRALYEAHLRQLLATTADLRSFWTYYSYIANFLN